jgi:hypothetical protein
VDTGPSPIHRSTSLTIERKVTGALNCAGYGGSPAVLSATVADDAMIEVAHVSAGAESRAAIVAGASMLIASNAVAAECDSVSTVAGVTEARRFAARPAAVDERAPESDFADSRTCSTLSVSTTSMSPSAGSSVSVPSWPGSRISGFCSST